MRDGLLSTSLEGESYEEVDMASDAKYAVLMLSGETKSLSNFERTASQSQARAPLLDAPQSQNVDIVMQVHKRDRSDPVTEEKRYILSSSNNKILIKSQDFG